MKILKPALQLEHHYLGSIMVTLNRNQIPKGSLDDIALMIGSITP